MQGYGRWFENDEERVVVDHYHVYIAGNKYTGNQRDDEYFRGCMQNEIDARARASVSDG